MANNRLYLYDPKTKERFMLAKSFSSGWQIWHKEDFAERLQAWFDNDESYRDENAVYGAINVPTSLILLSEGELPD